METEIYIPPNSLQLDKPNDVFQQFRVGIQGRPKTGKTHSAVVTFPDPIVVSFDRGLRSFLGLKIIEVPFYDDKYVDLICPRIPPLVYVDIRDNKTRNLPANRKDALVKWLGETGPKLTRKQTLVLDGGTGIQAAYHTQYWVQPQITKGGEIQSYAEYKMKIDYFTEIMFLLKSLNCNVVYLTHEYDDVDKQGNKTGRNRPLLSGQFEHELASHFTDWFRALVFDKPENTSEAFNKFKAFFSLDIVTAQEWIKSTPPECKSIFVWQTQPDSKAECGTSLFGAPKYILARYDSLLKYQRKTTT